MSAARPETGATDADIEAAAKRVWVALHPGDDHPWPFPGDRLFADIIIDMQNDIRDNMGSAAEHLVPPGTVIALAEHVVSSADREAIGRALALIRAVDKYATFNAWGDVEESVIEELASAAEQTRVKLTADDLARLERLGRGGEETT